MNKPLDEAQILRVHAITSAIGAIRREVDEIGYLLRTAQSALKRGRLQVVDERIGVSLEALRGIRTQLDIIYNHADYPPAPEPTPAPAEQPMTRTGIYVPLR